MAERSCGALVLSALDEIAWFFNLRGSDIAYNPGTSFGLLSYNQFSLRMVL
jgi:hypothetical protein